MINEQQNIASRSKNNILIIEDDLSLSDNLEIFLTKKKFNVLISHTGKDALKICLQQPPDLIICDIMLPDMNGYSIIKTIKMNEPTKSVPFIFLSALADGSDVQKGLDLGAQTYLTKPLKVNKLLEIIYSSIDTSNEEKQTILIIEDDTDMRDNLNSIFSKNGYKVVSAQNGQEGLEKALNFKPNLVVCDVMLPDIDGYSVLEELMRSETRAVPFIYLSAKSELSDVRRGMSLGADDFITKPFKTDDLLNSVKMRIHKQKIIKRHYKSSNSIPDKSDVIKKVNKAEEDAKLITRKKDIENLFSHSCKKIILTGKQEEDSTSREVVLKPSNNQGAMGYDDSSFEYFLNNRDHSKDYQSYYYKKNVLAILVNLHRAVQNEAMPFNNYLQKSIGNGYKKIVIDMTSIDFMDSTYAGVLISAIIRITPGGGKMKLVMKKSMQFANPIIQQSLENNFEIFRGLKTAIQSF